MVPTKQIWMSKASILSAQVPFRVMAKILGLAGASSALTGAGALVVPAMVVQPMSALDRRVNPLKSKRKL